MQRNTNLGMSLGSLLSNAFSGQNRQKGVWDAESHNADVAYKTANAEKTRVETLGKQQEIDNSSDDGLAKGLLASIGANSNFGLNDFKATMAGTYKPPQEQQGASLTPEQRNRLNPSIPEYVSKFPELQQKFAGLKQMLALGDKNISNLSKSIQGDQRNNITKGLNTATPQQAAEIGMRTSAIEGNVNPLEMMKASLVHGLTNGKNSPDAQNALLLSQGKTRYDNMGGTGTFDLLTGDQSLNDLGLSGVQEKKAQANQANAGANENNAQAGLANTRTQHIKDGKGDGSNATMKDMSQIRDDVRSEYNATYPINGMTGTRKNAPDFRAFEKSWLKQFNVDEKDYYRKSGSNQPAPTKTKSNPAYDEYMAAFNQAKGRPDIQKKITERARTNKVVK